MKRSIGFVMCGLMCGLLFGSPIRSESSSGFDAGKLTFSVRVQGEQTNYRVLGLFVMPGEKVTFKVVDPIKESTFSINSEAGRPKKTAPRSWSWIAPSKPGLTRVNLSRNADAASMNFNVFVMTPLSQSKKGKLNGYTIGEYPRTAYKGLSAYVAPKGLVEVSEQTRNVKVSPHFTIGQFLCKQAEGYPKFVLLRTRLLLKLEALLEVANEKGFRADTFYVMSGYRTPYYNKAIGNVKYSRHVYGGAADIFIDVAPKDGVMDDLNGDGRIDVADAGVLYDMIDDLYEKTWYSPFVGGLGRYKATSARGPFVHVDVRGSRARWGT